MIVFPLFMLLSCWFCFSAIMHRNRYGSRKLDSFLTRFRFRNLVELKCSALDNIDVAQSITLQNMRVSDLKDLFKRLGGKPGVMRKSELYSSCLGMLDKSSLKSNETSSISATSTRKKDQIATFTINNFAGSNIGQSSSTKNTDMIQDTTSAISFLKNESSSTIRIELSNLNNNKEKPSQNFACPTPKIRSLPLLNDEEVLEIEKTNLLMNEETNNNNESNNKPSRYVFPTGHLRDSRFGDQSTNSGIIIIYIYIIRVSYIYI